MTRYTEFVIQGPRGWTLGFIQGFLHARGKQRAVLDAEAEGFDCAPLRERLMDLLGTGSETLHLLVPRARLDDVRGIIKKAKRRGESVELRHERPVDGARFSFKFSSYSKPHAKLLRGYFEKLPDGVELDEGTRFDETIDPDAKGVESYAPAHHYELIGSGSIHGDVDGVLSVYRSCRDEEPIRDRTLELL